MSDALTESRTWFVCPTCDGACWELRDGVCPGCHYCLLGGDLAPADALLNPSWTARLSVAERVETNWWCE